jgi:DNA-directed RNA polymerase subunit RPC12/RpoP
MKNCTECGKEIDNLSAYSKGECLECHEKNFDQENDHQIPNFIKTINV